MNPHDTDRARRTAAQAKADQVVRTLAGRGIESEHRLLVAVIDQTTNTRLATTFVAYDPTTTTTGLRLVQH